VVEAGAARRKEMQKVVVKAARGVALFYTSCQVPGRSVAMGDAKPGAERACLHGATHMYSDSHYNGYYNCSRAQGNRLPHDGLHTSRTACIYAKAGPHV
jgi:hypothetical protein